MREVRYPLSTGVTLAGDLYEGATSHPRVVFLHGGGQTRHAWGNTAARVAEAGFTALTLDHRGHGDSSWAPDGDYFFSAFARDFHALVQQLEEPPLVIGASLGGLTAITTEADHLGALRAMVLVDVTPRLQRDGVIRIFDFMTGRPEGFASLEEAAEAVAAYLPHRGRPKSTRGLEKNLRRGDDGRYRWHWDPEIMRCWSPSAYQEGEAEQIIAQRLAQCERLRLPVLLVRGRMSDVVSEENAKEFLAHVPHAEYVDLAGAAHMVAGDRNDAFGGVALEFVRRHA